MAKKRHKNSSATFTIIASIVVLLLINGGITGNFINWGRWFPQYIPKIPTPTTLPQTPTTQPITLPSEPIPIYEVEPVFIPEGELEPLIEPEPEPERLCEPPLPGGIASQTISSLSLKNFKYGPTEKTEADCPKPTDADKQTACNSAHKDCMNKLSKQIANSVLNANQICQEECNKYKKEEQICQPNKDPLTVNAKTTFSMNNCIVGRSQVGKESTDYGQLRNICILPVSYSCIAILNCKCDP